MMLLYNKLVHNIQFFPELWALGIVGVIVVLFSTHLGALN
jgi:hypothetical protein